MTPQQRDQLWELIEQYSDAYAFLVSVEKDGGSAYHARLSFNMARLRIDDFFIEEL